MKLFDWMLRFLPETFRRDHETELRDFVEREAKSLPRGITAAPARAVFWVRTVLDVFRVALRLRRESRPAGSRELPRFERLTAWSSDVRYGVRSLLGAPLASLVVLVTLALGIGLNTAVFSVVSSVLLKPLPYEAPERLVWIGALWDEDGEVRARHSGGHFATIRDEATSFVDVAAVRNIRQNMTGIETPAQVQVGWASRNLFDLLGVSPALGHGFTPDAPEGTAVLSHQIWERDFSSDPDVIGRVIELDGFPYTIAGVLPNGFRLFMPRFPGHIDVWKVPDDWWQNGDVWSEEGVNFALLDLVARLDERVSVEQASHELNRFAEVFQERQADYARSKLVYEVVPLRDSVVGSSRPYVLLLFGAVGLVLLVACANVMNLMLARAQVRANEMSLRMTLGSSRARIVRLLFVESLLLAAAGGLAGVGLGALCIELFRVIQPANVARLDTVALDQSVLAFAVGISVLSTLVFGLAPALAATRGPLASRFLGARATVTRNRRRLSHALVVAELSLSFVLLVGAGLLSTSLTRLADVQPGFDDDNLLTFSVSLPGTDYERPAGTDRFFRELERRIEELPGVASAGVVWPLPLSGRPWSSRYVAGAVTEGESRYAQYRLATESFFPTMGIPILEGRTFAVSDPRNVAVVSRSLAAKAFPGESALGRTVQAEPWGGGMVTFEVIGVVDDVRYGDLREPPEETLYFDSRGWSWTDWEVDFVVRTIVAPESVVLPIADALASMDGSIPLARVKAMDAYVDEHLADTRFASRLVGLFAVVAGLLAAVGLYGVVSLSVSQRVHEIGVRMALGAERSRILRSVLGQGLRLMSLGVLFGLVVSLYLTRFLGSLLYGVEAWDVGTFVTVAVVLVGVGIAASGGPARRATRLDPMSVLRAD